MQVVWTLLGIALFVYLFVMLVTGARRRGETSFVKPQKIGRHGPDRDLGANINPSQHGNEVDLWPDRTGAQTRRELGARNPVDMTFRGDRPEQKGGRVAAPAARPEPTRHQAPPMNPDTFARVVERPDYMPITDSGSREAGADPAPSPGVRREVQAGPHEHGPGTNARADLAPEDHLGEDRPAPRTHAPDAQPTQWHPENHGVPGDHYRDGHHRSASAPERTVSTSDPYAHAPLPGPNHILPEGGDELPPGTRP